jgi:hypothetical protein
LPLEITVPSSTSNSNARLPGGPHDRILAAGLALAVGLVVLHEGFVRTRGFIPSVTDDVQLWSLRRSEVARDDEGEIVLIGASRIQSDIDGEVFAKEFSGRKPKQLAIVGSSAIPVLEHFARDQSFKGLIICDVMPIHFFTGIDKPAGQGAEFVAYAKKDRPWDLAATCLRVFLESRLVLRAPHVSPSPPTLLGLLGLRPLPRQHTVVDADRYTHINRKPDEVPLQDIEALARATEQAFPVSAERLNHDLAALDYAVRRIQTRGGKVIFTVLPVSGLRREAEERRFPRSMFWDKFAAQIHAVTIHFADHAELSKFLCYDGSHLSSSTAAAFTQSFTSVLKTKLHGDAPFVGRPGHSARTPP